MEFFRGEAIFRYGMSKPEQLEQWLTENRDQLVGFCFTGRSNVGKSSLINSFFGKKTARTSKTPGRTREVNIFEFSLAYEGKKDDTLPPLYFFDLPGYGHAEVSAQMSRNWNTLMDVFFTHLPPSVHMVNIQDARHPHQKSDQKFHDFLKNFHHETSLVFNKIDKLKTQKERSALNKLKPKLFSEYKWVKDIHFVSAERRDGLDVLEQALISSMMLFLNDKGFLQD
jgi:GTP-binding protein